MLTPAENIRRMVISLQRAGYRYLLKPVLFRCDPERVHEVFTWLGKILGSITVTQKNDGCEAIAKRLGGKSFSFPIGISIAKTNSPDTVDVEKGIADYEKAFRTLQAIGSLWSKPCSIDYWDDFSGSTCNT